MPLPNVESFTELVQWIVKTHHADVVLSMATKTGVSQAMLNRWYHGQAKHPTLETIVKVCSAYDFDPRDVMGMLTGATTKKRPGTRAARRAIKAMVAMAMLAATAGSTVGSPAPHNTTRSEPPDDMRLIGHSRRRRIAA